MFLWLFLFSLFLFLFHWNLQAVIAVYVSILRLRHSVALNSCSYFFLGSLIALF